MCPPPQFLYDVATMAGLYRVKVSDPMMDQKRSLVVFVFKRVLQLARVKGQKVKLMTRFQLWGVKQMKRMQEAERRRVKSNIDDITIAIYRSQRDVASHGLGG